MTKFQLEKMILDETKDLPTDTLQQILECIRSIKEKKLHRSTKDRNVKIPDELRHLTAISLLHLEEEFTDYKELYPCES